jgi:hypothetical protein
MAVNGKESMRQSKWKEFMFLLRREFLFQLDGRRSYSRGVYPGVNWFALLCAGALLLEFNASRLAPESSGTVIDHFTFLTLAQAFLIALRSSVYCAVSMSRDLQNHTATVIRVSPVSRTVSLAAKLGACLAPLWIELALFLPVSLLFFSVYLWLSPTLVASTVPFLVAVSLVCGCLGLVIGSATVVPQHAARNARLFVFFLLFLVPMLKSMSQGWTVPVVGLALWLSGTTRRAPHRNTVLGVFAALIVALGFLHSGSPSGFTLSNLHPLNIAEEYYPAAFISQELTFGSGQLLTHPLAMAGVYLVLAAIFFLLARTRYSHAR